MILKFRKFNTRIDQHIFPLLWMDEIASNEGRGEGGGQTGQRGVKCAAMNGYRVDILMTLQVMLTRFCDKL